MKDEITISMEEFREYIRLQEKARMLRWILSEHREYMDVRYIRLLFDIRGDGNEQV